jgi:ssRNA-specific RNase YbeY (16S rRNA maturation enzyme)
MISFSYYSNEYIHLPLESLKSSLFFIAAEEGRELAETTVIFCADDELLSLNQLYLNHNYYTDIITFDYSTEAFICGDLFVSVDRVLDNASI